MQLTPGVTINPGDTVTRQTIYDLVANAIGGTVQSSDLHASVQTITSQTDVPTPYPGKVWYDQEDGVLKVFVDELDGTGVSLWVTFGPDRFEIPMLATEDIPYGAAVQMTGIGRQAKLPPAPAILEVMDWQDAQWEHWKVMGWNNTGRVSDHTTAASGTWFSCAIEGLVWAWHPVNRAGYATGKASVGTGGSFDSLISGWSATTAPTSTTNVAGGVVYSTFTALQDKAPPALLLGMEEYSAWHKNWSKQPFWGARRGRV